MDTLVATPMFIGIDFTLYLVNLQLYVFLANQTENTQMCKWVSSISNRT